MQDLNSFASQAADVMMRGAVSFIRSLPAEEQSSIDLDAVVAEMKARSAAAIDEALKDAARAMEVPAMPMVAEASFRATMVLAGIDAVKAVVAKGAK